MKNALKIYVSLQPTITVFRTGKEQTSQRETELQNRKRQRSPSQSSSQSSLPRERGPSQGSIESGYGTGNIGQEAQVEE